MTEINILGFVGCMIFCKPEYLLKRHFPKVFEPLLKRPQLGYLSWDGRSAWPEELDGLVRISLFSSVQLFSRVWLFANRQTAECQASLSITNFQSLLKLMSTESVMPSNHFILCCPLLLLPSIFLSIRAFSNELTLCIRWPNVTNVDWEWKEWICWIQWYFTAENSNQISIGL